MKKEVSNPTEMLRLILWIAGSGSYRLVLFKKEKEKIKTKYAILRVLQNKVELIKIVSTPHNWEHFLEKSWQNLKTNSPHVSFFHKENGDIRVWLWS